MKVGQLLELGFIEAGACSLDTRLKSGVRFTITKFERARVLYAFAVDEDVQYIGVCDSSRTHLADRMSRYQGMMGAGTNERIVGYIREALSQGSRVRIFAWRPEQEPLVGSLSVDLVKGLENPLIDLAKPSWNIHS